MQCVRGAGGRSCSRQDLTPDARAKSMEKAIEAVKESISEVDAYHQQFKRDTWVKGIQSRLMLDLSRITNEEKSA